MKIKGVTQKPDWWDSCKNVILESKNYHKAIIKKCNGKLILCWFLLDEEFFEVEENGDDFYNEEELRLHIEQMFSWMMEDLNTIIFHLTIKLKKADEVVEKQKKQLESTAHAMETLVGIVKYFKNNRGN